MRKVPLGPNKFQVSVIEHNGGINGFATTIVRMVDNRRLVVLLDNTERGQYLDQIAARVMSILYDQTYELPKRSIAELLLNTIVTRDVASGIKQYRGLKTGPSAGEYDFAETELNSLGYRLLQMRKIAEAIEIFKLNVEMYPQSSNVYDSLGEAYRAHGDKDLAVTNYQKSLELDPKNTNATAKLAALKNDQKEVKADPKIYDTYAGDYELEPGLTITITSENGRLMAQLTGQQKLELFPSSETEFSLRIVDAQVTFVRDEQGKVTGLILNQNGRRMTAKKIR
jgi:tetratricopeptide (TPR) repeat protein